MSIYVARDLTVQHAIALCMTIAGLTFAAVYTAIKFMVTNPMAELSGVIDKIVSGNNLGCRINLSMAGLSRELRAFASDFNTLLDMIEERQTEIVRRDESLKLFAKLFDNIGDGIVISDANHKILAVNPAFLRLTGYSMSEVIGESPQMFASSAHDLHFYHEMQNTLTTTGRWSGSVVDKRRDGKAYSKYLSIDVIKDDAGQVVNFISIHTDNTERIMAEERMHFLAYYDVLTELPNRSLLHDRLGQFIAFAQRNSSNFAVLFLDLDRFKLINDTMGHAVGDKLLQSVAGRIRSAIRDIDTVARIGGDEFVVVLQDVGIDGAKKVAQHIIDIIRNEHAIDGHQIASQTSIGIAVYPDDGADIESLIKNADIAMYQAKKDGRNNYRFFSEGMGFHAANLFSMEKDLHAAIAQNEFYLEYQPQLSFATNKPCGAEALIRWQHQRRGLVSPVDFIPVAEDTGQILTIGEWVIRAACQDAARWLSKGHELVVAVNVSAKQFAHPNFIQIVQHAIDSAGIPPSMLEVELTEGVMMENVNSAIGIMTKLRNMGVLLSVDDFGTGFSSLAYIRQMPITQFKIDRTFVSDLDNGDAAITEHIIALGHRIGLDIIAEGAETDTQISALRMMGCDKVQGFCYAQPMRMEKLLEFLSTQCLTKNVQAA